MTPLPQPPTLALALLRRVASGNDPLIGDLIEEFQAGRSRGWFWRQVLMAALPRPWRRRRAAKARLDINVRRPQEVAGVLDVPMGIHNAPLEGLMNITAVRASGIGGLGLLVVAVLMVVDLPQLQPLMVSAACGGVVLGTVMILRRRRRGLSGPSRNAPGDTFHRALAGQVQPPRAPRTPQTPRLRRLRGARTAV
jgi:hypothetical protein